MAGDNAERRVGLLPIKGCENTDRSGDVIFVHGLGDHPITTWYPNPAEIKEEVDTDHFWRSKLPNLDFWLNWLGNDRPDIGIWSYGYEAMPFKESSFLVRVPKIGDQIPTGKASLILDQASELLDLLQQQDILQRPRIFVTHSLGGLIVKQILRSAKDLRESNPKMKQFLRQTKGVIFLATPHRGSDLANFKELLAQVIKAFHLLEENVILQELSSDNTNDKLYDMGIWYRNNASHLRIATKAYRETEETDIPVIGKRLVVDRFSSDPDVQGVEVTAVNGADHFSIAKPNNNHRTVYKGVKELISEHLPQRSPGSKSVEKEQQEESFFLTN